MSTQAQAACAVSATNPSPPATAMNLPRAPGSNSDQWLSSQLALTPACSARTCAASMALLSVTSSIVNAEPCTISIPTADDNSRPDLRRPLLTLLIGPALQLVRRRFALQRRATHRADRAGHRRSSPWKTPRSHPRRWKVLGSCRGAPGCRMSERCETMRIPPIMVSAWPSRPARPSIARRSAPRLALAVESVVASAWVVPPLSLLRFACQRLNVLRGRHPNFN